VETGSGRGVAQYTRGSRKGNMANKKTGKKVDSRDGRIGFI
jgi:hypothetical protein